MSKADADDEEKKKSAEGRQAGEGNSKEENDVGKGGEPPDEEDFKLEEKEWDKLETLLDELDNHYKRVSIKRVTRTGTKMYVKLDDPDEKYAGNNPTGPYKLKRISVRDAVKYRGYLKQEYEYEHQVGQHWDNLRWNVSKFFLGIQTVFVVAAMKGLLELAKDLADTKTNLVHRPLIVWGLILLASFNIGVCVIWGVRNLGIHAWHRAAIKRQRLIELDPRWKHIPWLCSGVIQTMRSRRGLLGRVGRTGELECWGPPVAFCLLWIGLMGLSVYYGVVYTIRYIWT